jgi:hypothetical protein
MAAEVKFDQQKARRRPASKPASPAVEFEGRTGSSAVVLARGSSLHKPPSGYPLPHEMARRRPVGEKPAVRVD